MRPGAGTGASSRPATPAERSRPAGGARPARSAARATPAPISCSPSPAGGCSPQRRPRVDLTTPVGQPIRRSAWPAPSSPRRSTRTAACWRSPRSGPAVSRPAHRRRADRQAAQGTSGTRDRLARRSARTAACSSRAARTRRLGSGLRAPGGGCTSCATAGMSSRRASRRTAASSSRRAPTAARPSGTFRAATACFSRRLDRRRGGRGVQPGRQGDRRRLRRPARSHLRQRATAGCSLPSRGIPMP